MADITLAELRLLGGQATLKKYGKDHYRKMSEKGVAARKAKRKSPAPQP